MMTPLLTVRRAVILAVAASLLVACGQGGAPGVPETSSRSAGARPSVTATFPDVSRPPTRPEMATETAELPGVSRSAPRPAPPTAIPTTTEPPDQTATGPVLAAPVPSATPSPPAAGATPPADATSWSWWLLGAIVVVIAVVVPLVLRSRRRRAWHDDLAAVEREIGWFARWLIPELRRAASPDQAVGAWTVESGRVSALEDRLTGLEATARDDAGRSRARDLRDAVRAASRRLDILIRSGQFDTLPWDLDAVAAELEAALAEEQADM